MDSLNESFPFNKSVFDENTDGDGKMQMKVGYIFWRRVLIVGKGPGRTQNGAFCGDFHAVGPEPSFWQDFDMVLHGFVSRSSINTLNNKRHDFRM